jgi:hypothetical protein
MSSLCPPPSMQQGQQQGQQHHQQHQLLAALAHAKGELGQRKHEHQRRQQALEAKQAQYAVDKAEKDRLHGLLQTLSGWFR